MPVSDPTETNVVQLSSAEQWVVHHVILDSLGLADGKQTGAIEVADPPKLSLSILDKLENGSFEFTPEELRLLQRTCHNHANLTQATADKNLASSVADRIDAVMANRAIGREEPEQS